MVEARRLKLDSNNQLVRKRQRRSSVAEEWYPVEKQVSWHKRVDSEWFMDSFKHRRLYQSCGSVHDQNTLNEMRQIEQRKQMFAETKYYVPKVEDIDRLIKESKASQVVTYLRRSAN